MPTTAFAFLFQSGASVPWLLLWAAGLWFARRHRAEPGAGRAAIGFGVLTACGAVGFGMQVWMTVALANGTVDRYRRVAWNLTVAGQALGLMTLAAHGLLVAALVTAWRAAEDPPDPADADPLSP